MVLVIVKFACIKCVPLASPQTQSMMQSLQNRSDAFEQCCLSVSLHDVVPMPTLYNRLRQSTFGWHQGPMAMALRHLARAEPSTDYARILRSHIYRQPKTGSLTWEAKENVAADLQPLNINLFTAWRRAQDHAVWRRTVEMVMLQQAACSW